VPTPDRRRPVRRRPRRLRCETCLDVLTLRHAWDVATCSCGALMVSGRPTRPTVHWLCGPGGGWTELCPTAADGSSPPDAAAPDTGSPDTGMPTRRLGFAGPVRRTADG